jgi:hypothetical protein
MEPIGKRCCASVLLMLAYDSDEPRQTSGGSAQPESPHHLRSMNSSRSAAQDRSARCALKPRVLASA